MMWLNNQKQTISNLAGDRHPLHRGKIHPLVKAAIESFKSLRQWLDKVEIHNRHLAWLISKVIPGQCPFERDIKVFGRTIAHIPPLCKLNPLYEQLAHLRFRALCYLVDR